METDEQTIATTVNEEQEATLNGTNMNNQHHYQNQEQQEQQEQQLYATYQTGAAVTEEAQKERRHSIRDILADESLTPLEKRRSIQSLMDGRRRSSNATHNSGGDSTSEDGMARAAAEAASYYTSDNEDDPMDGTSSVANNGSGGGGGVASAATVASGSATAAYQYGDATGAVIDSSGDGFHRRKERSTSLPGWSEVGLVAPVAASSTATAAARAKIDPNSIWDDPLNVNRRMEKSRPACTHYERNCTIISPCCGLAFGCRICHDDCPVLPMPFVKRPQEVVTEPEPEPTPARIHWAPDEAPKRKQEKRPSLPLGFDEEETHHDIDRFAIREIICRLCYVRQSSKT